MRNITPAGLAFLNFEQGAEPLNVVGIDWAGNNAFIYYSDQYNPGIYGKILALTNLENVINISGNSNSQSIHIQLDDTDGIIKNVINYTDIHKKPVRVYQWFKGLPFEDMFLIFEGEISSPIIWNEGNRTLDIDVISKLEDREVGFSAEEGDFQYVPPNLTGRAWPLVFGVGIRVPSVRVNDIPQGISAETVGINTEPPISDDPASYVINNNNEALSKAHQQYAKALTAAINALAMAAELRFRQIIDVLMPPADWYVGVDYTSQIRQYEQQADSAQEQARSYLEQIAEIRADNFYNGGYRVRSSAQKSSFVVQGANSFPQGVTVSATLRPPGQEPVIHEGQFVGNVFNITKQIVPWTGIDIVSTQPVKVREQNVSVKYQERIDLQKLWIAPGGSTLTISSQTIYPIRYIACLDWCNVLAVFANRNFNGVNKVSLIPNTYYRVIYEDFGAIKATLIEFYRPLSSYNNEGWDDEIYCDLGSVVGPNIADILIYLIQTYTSHGYDATSFNHVRTLLQPYPANFALTSRVNIITLLQDIAFQARCAIWYKEGKFYIKYLSEYGTQVDQIEDDDVEANSFELLSTETENIVTRLVALWQPNYALDQFRIILRHNIELYGTLSEEYNFYIYAHQELVEKSATFWLIQKSNVWKRIRFSTFLTKLRLETYDTVRFNFSRDWIALDGVLGRIESVSYDSENNRVNIVAWIPIRMGEMYVYPFAVPHDIDETLIFPVVKPETVVSTLPSTVQGILYDQSDTLGTASPTFSKPYSTRASNRNYWHPDIPQRVQLPPEPPGISDRNDTSPGGTYLVPPAINTNIGTDTSRSAINNQWTIKELETPRFKNDVPGVFPGTISGVSEDFYVVRVFYQGYQSREFVEVRATAVSRNLKVGDDVHVVKSVQIIPSGPIPRSQSEFTIISSSSAGGVVPGRIDSGSGFEYRVKLFENGWYSAYTRVVTAFQLDIDPEDFIPFDTPVTVFSLDIIGNDGLPTKEYYINTPIWAANE